MTEFENGSKEFSFTEEDLVKMQNWIEENEAHSVSFQFSSVPIENTQNKFIIVDNNYYYWDSNKGNHSWAVQELIDQGIIDLDSYQSVYAGGVNLSNSMMETGNRDLPPGEKEQYKLSSILSPVQDELAVVIWNGDQLREEVKDFCFSKVEELLKDFMDEEQIPVLLKKVLLIGSITGYQYDDDADLDVNVTVDLDTVADNMGLEKELLIYEMRGRVGEINGDVYPGTEHPVNLFLSTQEGHPPADGIYDMITDEWIKRPGHPGNIDPYANLKDSIDRAEEIAAKIDAKWGAANRTYEQMQRYPSSGLQIKRQLIRYLKSLVRILENVVNERREVFELAREQGIDPPQTSTPNIVYKYLEINGLLETLHTAEHILEAYDENGELNFGMEILSKGSRLASNGQRYQSRGRLPDSNPEGLEVKIGIGNRGKEIRRERWEREKEYQMTDNARMPAEQAIWTIGPDGLSVSADAMSTHEILEPYITEKWYEAYYPESDDLDDHDPLWDQIEAEEIEYEFNCVRAFLQSDFFGVYPDTITSRKISPESLTSEQAEEISNILSSLRYVKEVDIEFPAYHFNGTKEEAINWLFSKSIMAANQLQIIEDHGMEITQEDLESGELEFKDLPSDFFKDRPVPGVLNKYVSVDDEVWWWVEELNYDVHHFMVLNALGLQDDPPPGKVHMGYVNLGPDLYDGEIPYGEVWDGDLGDPSPHSTPPDFIMRQIEEVQNEQTTA